MQERELRAAMHMLPLPGVEVQAWDVLADRVRRTGRAAVRSALGDQLYPVPSVAGAKGATLEHTAATPCQYAAPCHSHL